jgi:hypothetical protein
MKQSLCVWLIGGIGLVLQISCDSGPLTAPSVSEQLVVTATTRAAIPGEPVPTIHVSGGATHGS